MKPVDMAVEILQKTRDGANLAPAHLYILQCAVNSGLSEAGEVAFYDLYAKVKKGYRKPWHFGIVGVTKDHEGYIYWKDTRIEHYTFDDADKEREAAKRLQTDCRTLETRGLPVNGKNLFALYDEQGGGKRK